MSKWILGVSAVVFIGLCTAALAGAKPERVEQATSCHGRPAMQAVEQGCHGLQFVAPAAVQGGCHGGRLTWSERRTARSMARANYSATLAAARSAGRAGNGIQSVNYSAPAMTMVPVAAAKCECGDACTKACKCGCHR